MKKAFLLMTLWCITLSMIAQTAEIRNMEVDGSAHYMGSSLEGLGVNFDVKIRGMKGKDVIVGFFVYDANKDQWCINRRPNNPFTRLQLAKDTYAICDMRSMTPQSDDMGWEHLEMFMSTDELHLKDGNNMYYCVVKVWEKQTDKLLAQSNYKSFTAARKYRMSRVGFAYRPQQSQPASSQSTTSYVSSTASRSSSQSSGSSSQMKTRSSKNYFDDSFQTISRYNVQGNYITLEKKLNMSDYRTNGDGNRFYRTTLAVTVTSNGRAERNILDTDLYTTSNFWKAHLPCMMVDPQKKVLYIFANSKASDRYYGMNGYVYRLDQNSQRWTRETVFTDANYGWFSFFGGSNNGNPELWHFSYAGYYAMKSTRSSSGYWNTSNMGSITPQKADNDYASHENILVASRSGVDRMFTGSTGSGSNSYARSSSSSSNSIIPGISDKAVVTTAAVVGTGAILYGLFKLFTAGGGSSSGSSYSSSSYSSGSSYSSSNSYSSSSSSSSDRRESSSSSYNSNSSSDYIDPETVSIPSWEVVSIDNLRNTPFTMKGKRYHIHFKDTHINCKVEEHDGIKGVWSNSNNCYYDTFTYAVEAGYVKEKYLKERKKGMK